MMCLAFINYLAQIMMDKKLLFKWF